MNSENNKNIDTAIKYINLAINDYNKFLLEIDKLPVKEKQEIDQIKAENTNESVKVEDKKIVKELSKESGEVATKETKQEITKAEDENVNDSSKVEDKEVTNESPKEEEK